MANERVQGLAAAQSLFNSLPDAARIEMSRALADIAKMVLAAQQQDVPVDTGGLKAGLVVELLLAQLRVKIGLLSVKRGRSDLFYSRFVEFGRRAQTVTVQRRRRADGRLRTQARGSRKRASDIVSTYSLAVKARAARPFILKDRPALDARIAERLADFWDKAFLAAGGGS